MDVTFQWKFHDSLKNIIDYYNTKLKKIYLANLLEKNLNNLYNKWRWDKSKRNKINEVSFMGQIFKFEIYRFIHNINNL